MVEIVNVNLLAVLGAAVFNMVLGAIWYSPYVFGEQWMRLVGITERDMQKNKKEVGKYYALSFVGALIMSYVLAHIINYVDATSIYQGIETGAWIWLGFVATALMPAYVFENRPMKLYGIYALYQLIALLGMGAILTLWV